MKLKLLGLTFAAINVCTCLSAQNIYFEYSDGTNSTYAIDDVRKITFTDDIMNLHLNDGSSYSWDVESIDHYQYELNPLQIDALLRKVNSMEVHVHPNPVDNSLIVSYFNKEKQNLCLSIFDLQGRILLEENNNSIENGKTSHIIELSSLPSGQYFVRLTGPSTLITKKIIKK